MTPKSIVREHTTCRSCINYNAGTCAFRLNSPDHFTAKVHALDLACDNYGTPSTRLSAEPQPTFSTLDEVSVSAQGNTKKGHSYRKTMSLSVLSVDALHRLGYVDQQYPCIAAQVEHNNESVIFFLPNTKTHKINTQLGRHTIASNRYDVVKLFKRIADKGVIDLRQWRRVQLNID